jgi:hypothetical protein
MSRGERNKNPRPKRLAPLVNWIGYSVDTLQKIFENFFQKPLDKYQKLWYNINTVREGKPT